MIVIEIFQYLLVAIVGFMVAYPTLLSMLSLRGRQLQSFETSRNRKFAVVIVSNNDEKVIAKSLYSLSGLVYPKNMFDLIVVTDHCSDKSAEIARSLGAIVLDQDNQEKIKNNDILFWAFEEINNRNLAYEAIVLFNSNSLISGNYLEVMNYYLEKGDKVIQSSIHILPGSGSWSREVKRLSFLLKYYVRPLGRKVLGLNTELRCNGICISTDVLKGITQEKWPTDKELGLRLDLQLNEVKKGFAPEAKVYEQSDKSTNNNYLQKIGYLNRLRKLLPKIAVQKGKKYLDSLMMMLAPSQTNLFLFVILMCGLNILLWYLNLIHSGFIWTWIGIGTLSLLHILIGLIAAKADRQLYKTILYMPAVLFLYIKRCVRDFFYPAKEKQLVDQAKKRSDAVSSL